ncbi:39S ribosomal protein L14, mitochondrial [Tyrophagus putrescentiae]|nr:39S ribosomal protein L14, mitochondrial [Tyrophagus putrescentiae]
MSAICSNRIAALCNNHLVGRRAYEWWTTVRLGKEAMTEGKKVKCIHVYKKSKVMDGQLGDKVLVTIKGQMKRGYVVGLVAEQRPMVPKFDTNNVVLVENNGNPTGTRVVVPIPNYLRSKGPELAKIIAISSRFV